VPRKRRAGQQLASSSCFNNREKPTSPSTAVKMPITSPFSTTTAAPYRCAAMQGDLANRALGANRVNRRRHDVPDDERPGLRFAECAQISLRNQPHELLPVEDGKMPDPKGAHQLARVRQWLALSDRAWRRRHVKFDGGFFPW